MQRDAGKAVDQAPSVSFDEAMLNRLGGFVHDMQEKIHELPASCAMWDYNGGKIPNGPHPANRVNAADGQYTHEHRMSL